MDITNFIRDGVTYPIGDAKSRESIATAFDSTASYSAGDYAMYDGTLYKFTSSHSGEWDSTHAEATCVTDELGSGGGGGNAQVMYYYQQPVNTATNAEIFRITNSKINTDTVVLECTFADPSYITSDVTWTSYDGYIAFTGTCTTATTANVTMAYKSDDIVTTVGLDLLYEGNPANNSNSNLITGKKFSDYKLLVISTGSTSINRFTYTIPISSDFYNPDNNNWIETEAASIWSLNFKYVSDTSFKIQDKGSSISFVRLYGDSKYSIVPSKHINPVDVTTKTRVATANSGPINAYVVPKNGYYAAITHTNQTSHEAAAAIAADNEFRNLYSSNYSAAKAWLDLTTEWIWLKEGTTIYWSVTYVSDSRYANDLGLFCADPVS